MHIHYILGDNDTVAETSTPKEGEARKPSIEAPSPGREMDDVHDSLRALNNNGLDSSTDVGYHSNREDGNQSGNSDDHKLTSSAPSIMTLAGGTHRRKPSVARRLDQLATGGTVVNGDIQDGNEDDEFDLETLPTETTKTKPRPATYECTHCQLTFGDCVMYSMHMGYHGNTEPFRCNMCSHLAKDRVEFFLHIARAAHE